MSYKTSPIASIRFKRLTILPSENVIRMPSKIAKKDGHLHKIAKKDGRLPYLVISYLILKCSITSTITYIVEKPYT